MDRSAAIAKLADLIRNIRIAMLTTTGPDGHLYSRPMVSQESDFDGTLWFFSRDDSPKTGELAHHQDVNVAFVDTKAGLFISLAGRASVVHDRAKAEELWNPAYKAWFPEGLDDVHLSLIRVDVTSAEYWEGPSNRVTRLLGYARAYATGGRVPPGENEKIAIGG